MKIAIMQPYIFPYIGYLQLISSVDKFVVYDDVNYIKQGWINRNRILVNCTDLMFTVPLQNASSFATINNTAINPVLYSAWKDKFSRTLAQAYGKAPYFDAVSELVTATLHTPCTVISELAVASLQQVCRYLGITTQFVPSSAVYNNSHLRAQDRVIDICTQEGADTYINVSGGVALYNKTDFKQAGMDLYFITPGKIVYPQFNCSFMPWLSIIDVLMFNSAEEAMQLLKQYELN